MSFSLAEYSDLIIIMLLAHALHVYFLDTQFSDIGIIGQENLFQILTGYTIRELFTAGIVYTEYIQG